jgi:hypothetical protein
MKALKTILVLTIMIVASTAVMHADNILLNGSFGSNNVPGGGYLYSSDVSPYPEIASHAGVTADGWSFSGLSGVQGNGSAFGYANSPSGTYAAYLQEWNGAPTINSAISQSVSLVNGAHYNLSFELAQRPGYAANPIELVIGNVVVGTFTPSGTGWQTFSYSFTAGGGSTTVEFESIWNGTITDSDSGLANVKLTATPEPTSLILLGTGLVCLAGSIRRKLMA